MKDIIKGSMFFFVLGILPLILPDYYLGLLIRILILTIFAMSLDILIGFTGLFSLGHAAYFGLAAYTVALLNTKIFQGSNSFVIEFGLGILASTITASIFGLIAMRAKGPYFMLITLGLAEMLWGLAVKWQHLTGGTDGLTGISRPQFFITSWNLSRDLNFFYFVFALFVLSFLITYLIVSSPFGHALVGIKENEMRMKVLGFNVWLHRYIAFLIGGTFAGLAGILDVYYYGFISPEILGVGNSFIPMIAVIIGGTGILSGSVIGSAVYISLEYIISGYTERWLTLVGLIFILIVFFAPRGLSPLMRRFWSLTKNRVMSGLHH